MKSEDIPNVFLGGNIFFICSLLIDLLLEVLRSVRVPVSPALLNLVSDQIVNGAVNDGGVEEHYENHDYAVGG
jgi:hypothetical protein